MEVIEDFPEDKEAYGLIKDNLIYNPYFKKVSNNLIRIIRLLMFVLSANQIIILRNAHLFSIFQIKIN